MPPKGKRSNKKKKKGGKKKAPPSASTRNAVENDLDHVMNVNDDKGQVLKWLKSCQVKSTRIDTKRVNKHMPHTANDLRSGKCDPKLLAASLTSFLNESSKQSSYRAENSMRFYVLSLVERVLSSVPNLDVVDEYDELFMEMVDDLAHKMRTEFRRFEKTLERDSENEDEIFEKLLKKAFHDLCKSWEEQLDKQFYNGQKGSFLRNCAVYHEEFHTVYAPLQNEAKRGAFGDTLEKHLCEEFNHIAEGIDREEETCWHCGITSPDTKVCGRCKVARFCGRECMEAAWKAYHKDHCPKIRDDYHQYYDSIAAVDEAHGSDQLQSRLGLNNMFDYFVAYELCDQTHSMFSERLREKLNGPHMKYFYENLERIVDGGWWLWEEDDFVEPIDREFLVTVAGYLAFDYFGYAEQYLNIKDPALVSFDMFDRRDLAMASEPFFSASGFLKAYREAYRSQGDFKSAKDKKQALSKFDAMALQSFRKAYQTGGDVGPSPCEE